MNRTALITGATDGIGRATAKEFVSEGWDVVIVGRNPSRCEQTVAELEAVHGGKASALVADLTVMAQVKDVADSFLASHDRLDFLFLNANAITQTRVLSSEGFESNFAIGHLGRALLMTRLRSALEAAPASQVMTVVGLDVERPDFDDLSMERGYSARSALRRWQWCTQIFMREFNRRSPVLGNIYIPGLVRTKILANEPQPMRTVVRIMNLVIGIPVEKAADNIYAVFKQVASSGAKGVTYSWRKQRKPLDLKTQPSDAEQLWSVTEELLKAY